MNPVYFEGGFPRCRRKFNFKNESTNKLIDQKIESTEEGFPGCRSFSS